MALGTLTVTILYLLSNVAYLSVLPADAIATAPQDRVGTAALQEMFGPAGLYLMAIAIMISTFGCNNGLILAGARVYYAMARDALFFRRMGALHPEHRTPTFALRLGLRVLLPEKLSPATRQARRPARPRTPRDRPWPAATWPRTARRC